MQNCKLEWLHRMLSEPKRLVKRYVHDALFIVPAFWREKNYRMDKAKPAKQDS